jgi:hypothetical protein
LQHIRKICHLKISKSEQLLTIAVVVRLIIVKHDKIILSEVFSSSVN